MKLFIWALSIAVVLVSAIAWLQGSPPNPTPSPTPPAPMQASTPSIGLTTVTPNVIGINTPTVVTVTAVITDPSLISTSVNLLRISATSAATIVGQLRDDGTNGDAVADDKIFTLRLTLTEPTKGQVPLQASAAFRGFLRRVTSSVVVVDVWNVFKDQTLGLEFAFPPQFSGSTRGSGQALEAFVFIPTAPNEPALFSIQTFLSQGLPSSLQLVASQRLGTEAIVASTPVLAGILVEADYEPPFHYFQYNSAGDKIIEVAGPDKQSFLSSDFSKMISTMRF